MSSLIVFYVSYLPFFPLVYVTSICERPWISKIIQYISQYTNVACSRHLSENYCTLFLSGIESHVMLCLSLLFSKYLAEEHNTSHAIPDHIFIRPTAIFFL